MNLTTDNWIPVLWNDGRADKISLLDVFQRGHEIRDLSVRPHERIALMRLLICIAQAALDGPKDRADWLTCCDRLSQAATDYLSKWEHAFELFGDGQRFLQAANVQPTKDAKEGDDDINSPSKLDLALATGNNTTLFDNAGGTDRIFSPDQLALMLLTFQNYSPGGRIGDVKWNGVPMGANSNHAPCAVKAMLHTYLHKSCLARTMHANLLTREQVTMLDRPWGKPIWEDMPNGPKAAAIDNATLSYLGRLVPMSRVVSLDFNGRNMVMGTAMPYPPDWREVAATIVIRERNGNPERGFLNASLAKSVWREAHSIAVLATTANQMLGGPLALASLSSNEGADVWCGALVTDKAKLLDAVESVLHIPPAMLAGAGQHRYQQGVKQAEQWGRKIGKAVAAYRRELHDELDKVEFRKRGNAIKAKAVMHYWTAVEQQVPALLSVVECPEVLYAEGSTKEDWGRTAWGKALIRTARNAYEFACPHETSRQLKAYSLGLNALFKPVETENEEPATEEAEA